MDAKTRILNFIQNHREVRSNQLVNLLGISRQKVAKHLSQLVEKGLIHKEGSTRNATYFAGKATSPKRENRIELVKSTKGLEEDKVYDEIALRLNLKRSLSKSAQSIAFYSFTEMLNNAIDHSNSIKTSIQASISGNSFRFEVRDYGIGIFEKVKKKFKLSSEEEALQLILKGKQTTMPEAHSGEGIFFTSRIADQFVIRSHKTKLTVDNIKDNISVADEKFMSGTCISFSIKKQSRKSLNELFKKYANEDLEFDRSTVRVSIPDAESCVSRSQARRLLTGLEKFKQVTFDFKGVKEAGQGFSDEVFRVYQQNHPKIAITYINAGPAVTFMIERAKREK